MILMPQIFDVIANENARYKRNELEYDLYVTFGLRSLLCEVETIGGQCCDTDDTLQTAHALD